MTTTSREGVSASGFGVDVVRSTVCVGVWVGLPVPVSRRPTDDAGGLPLGLRGLSRRRSPAEASGLLRLLRGASPSGSGITIRHGLRRAGVLLALMPCHGYRLGTPDPLRSGLTHRILWTGPNVARTGATSTRN